MAAVIAGHTGPNASLYRTGGDEFMLLCYKLDKAQVGELIAAIRGDLARTSYRCAIGCAYFSHQEDLDAVCQLADNMMYDDKRRMKGQTPA